MYGHSKAIPEVSGVGIVEEDHVTNQTSELKRRVVRKWNPSIVDYLKAKLSAIEEYETSTLFRCTFTLNCTSWSSTNLYL